MTDHPDAQRVTEQFSQLTVGRGRVEISARIVDSDGAEEVLALLACAKQFLRGEEIMQPVARCDECGREIILDCVVPNEVWHQIATREETLCPVCIDRRLTTKGLNVEARFSYHGTSLFSLDAGEPVLLSEKPHE